MDEFFGIPMEPLAAILVALVAVLLSALGALAIRNRIFLRLGLRNVTRRRARTALIVLGLMLGTTIISSALVTGDTMSHTIRTSAVQALGKTDVLVSVRAPRSIRPSSSARPPESSTSRSGCSRRWSTTSPGTTT
jgi:putative ABC transport system permease protein